MNYDLSVSILIWISYETKARVLPNQLYSSQNYMQLLILTLHLMTKKNQNSFPLQKLLLVSENIKTELFFHIMHWLLIKEKHVIEH